MSGVLWYGLPLEESPFGLSFGLYRAAVCEHFGWLRVAEGPPFPFPPDIQGDGHNNAPVNKYGAFGRQMRSESLDVFAQGASF